MTEKNSSDNISKADDISTGLPPKSYDLNQHAYDVLNRAFCDIRCLSKRPLNDLGKDHLFRIADAAHNIPSALAGNTFLAKLLESDVKTLEALLGKGKDGGYRAFSMRPPFQKVVALSVVIVGAVLAGVCVGKYLL